MKYVRNEAPPALRLRFHIRDKFGQDILRTPYYDRDTAIGHCYGTDSDNTIEYFRPGGYVEIDGHVNPNQETLDMLYAETTQRGITDTPIMDETIKKSEQDVRFSKGIEEQKQDEPVPEPET